MTDDHSHTECVNVFGHSRRLRILRLLIARPEIGRSLATLQGATGYSEDALLRHLEEMERKGLVSRTVAGHRVAGPRVPGMPLAAIARAARRTHLAAIPSRKVA